METLRSTKAALLLLFCVFVPSNSIMPKPGNCPRIFESFVAAPPCNYDNDCPHDQKCCTFFFRSVCVPPVPAFSSCPSHQGEFGACIEECSGDSDCADRNEICCSNGCGHVCMRPVSAKPGFCRSDDNFMPRCFFHCEYDSDCRGELKCCLSKCGKVCKEPWLG